MNDVPQGSTKFIWIGCAAARYDADRQGPERQGHMYGTSLGMKGNHAKGISIKFERSKAVLKASVTGKDDGAYSL